MRMVIGTQVFFQALGFLIRSKATSENDRALLKHIRAWFNAELERPARFNKASARSNIALSWYKSTATEHISHMYALVPIFENYDLLITVVKSRQPGYIVFEDDHQVVAIPFNKARGRVE